MSPSLIGVPIPCTCGVHAFRLDLPEAMTHRKSERCPYVAPAWQWEVRRGTCCTLNLGEVVEALRGFDEHDLAARLRDRLSAEESIEFGTVLERRGEKLLNTNCGEPETAGERAFLEACETILSAGAWYSRLGSDGFGVAPRPA